MAACQQILELVPEVQDSGNIVLEGSWATGGGSAMLEALSGAIPGLHVIGKMSAAKLGDELDTLLQVLQEVKRCVEVFDRMAWHNAHQKLSKLRADWLDDLRDRTDATAWPPVQDAATIESVVKVPVESPVRLTASAVASFFESHREKLSKHDDRGSVLEAEIKEVLANWEANCQLRALLYQETEQLRLFFKTKNGDDAQNLKSFIASEGDNIVAAALRVVSVGRCLKADGPKILLHDVSVLLKNEGDPEAEGADSDEGEDENEDIPLHGGPEIHELCSSFLGGDVRKHVLEEFLMKPFDTWMTSFSDAVIPCLTFAAPDLLLEAVPEDCSPLESLVRTLLAEEKAAGFAKQLDAAISRSPDVGSSTTAVDSMKGGLLSVCVHCTDDKMMCKAISVAGDLPTKVLMSMIEILALLHRVLLCACLLSVRFFKDSTSILSTVDGGGIVVHPHVVSLVHEMEACFRVWAGRIGDLNAAAVHALAFSPDAIKSLMSFLADSWLPHAKQRLFVMVEASLVGKSDELHRVTPVWSHLITGSKYNSALSKKQLLQPTLTTTLKHHMNVLHCLHQSFVFVSKEMSGAEVVDASPACADAMERLERARVAMTVCAAVGTIEGADADRAARATRLLKEGCLPDALRPLLKKAAASD